MTKNNPKKKKNKAEDSYGVNIGSLVQLSRHVDFFNPSSFLPVGSLGVVLKVGRFGKVYALMISTGEKRILYSYDYKVVICD